MPIQRKILWGYYCKGSIPCKIDNHLLSIGAWYLSTTHGDFVMPPLVIEFSPDDIILEFYIYIEPTGDYVVIEEKQDGLLKEAHDQHVSGWTDNNELLPMGYGTVEKGKELNIRLNIEELEQAWREIPEHEKEEIEAYNA